MKKGFLDSFLLFLLIDHCTMQGFVGDIGFFAGFQASYSSYNYKLKFKKDGAEIGLLSNATCFEKVV